MTLTVPRSSLQRASWTAAGAGVGLTLWGISELALADLPIWVRLCVAVPLLIFGPGALPVCHLLAPLSWLARVVLGFGFGLAFAPVMAHGLSLAGLMDGYPYLSAAAGGAAIGFWGATDPPGVVRDRRSWLAPAFLVLLAAGIGSVAFSNRMHVSRESIVLNGDYDAYDLSYYAAIAAEVSHTVPPASPFFAGRMLNHAYSPHLALAVIHRFGDVPLLDLYFRYAWPLFLMLAMLACFVFVQSFESTRAAVLSAALFGAGSDLSYLGVWFFPVRNWDPVIWSHNFQGAGAEALLYNNWTPAFGAVFTCFFALHAACRDRRLGWAVVAGVLLALTINAKPWPFAAILIAIAVTVVLSWSSPPVRRQLIVAAASALVTAVPILYQTVVHHEDTQVTFAPTFFPLPLVMVGRLGLDGWFRDAAAALGGRSDVLGGVAGLLAWPVFLVGSLGYRLVGTRHLWSTLRFPGRHEPIWRLLGWTVMAALFLPAFVVSVPYHETTQIHQFALFLLAIFVGRTLAAWRPSGVRAVATVLVVAAAIPSTVHYLHRKWNDVEHPLMDISREELQLVPALTRTDPETTVLLHNRPTRASLVNILSERRSVLAWGEYVRGSDSRAEDIDAFFASADRPVEHGLEILRRYRPTHVLEYIGRDRIHEDVTRRLLPISRNAVVALYAVPEELRRE